ncbi:MAG: sigma-54-dependent Fis family transcriptional regulator [Planctomycetaceae bacterium]|nr:sigma-54-dependent Fis family transcriptional regulator [Planctomycetaceae bacterium]
MLKEVLGKWGYQVVEAYSGEEALDRSRKEAFDIVLTDIRMAKTSGLDVLREFRRSHPRTQVIMMTGFGSVDTAVDAMKAGAFEYISKPFKFDEIKLTLKRAIEQLQAQADGGAAAQPDAAAPVTLVGHSRSMAEIYKTIARVAVGKSTVLIQGESGTGKELVARSIHAHSDRASKPYLAINCAAVPEALLESELFGYARGAHSTATSDKPGLFELASGGTLLLDEVGDMSLTLQAKLLRVLEDSETRRLGDTRTLRTDVRLIASTNKDLARLIREEKFRSDLFYRLNVVSITLPPLRERKEDIAGLVDYFLRKYSSAANKSVADAAPDVMTAFQAYGWPGNVRELENVIERAVILNSKSRIMLEDLPPAVRAPQPGGNLSLEEMERRHIVQVLQETKGNVKAAAGVLGIDRKTLYRKAAEYGIDIVRE